VSRAGTCPNPGGRSGAWLMLLPVSPVTVVIRNATAKPIASIRLEHERGIEILRDLSQGATDTIRFQAGGETSYSLRVQFADGSEMSGGARYAEPGYSFTETVGEKGIATETRLPGSY
jgi:hypothetical protein